MMTKYYMSLRYVVTAAGFAFLIPRRQMCLKLEIIYTMKFSTKFKEVSNSLNPENVLHRRCYESLGH